MKRRLFAILAGMVLAISLGATAIADPIVCPDNQQPAHNGGNWFCTASPNGNPTGAGWHRGNGNKL